MSFVTADLKEDAAEAAVVAAAEYCSAAAAAAVAVAVAVAADAFEPFLTTNRNSQKLKT